MSDITDRKRVELLFKSINEICNVRENIISDYEDYDFSRHFEEIKALDDSKRYIKFYEGDDQERILSVQKPIIRHCPEPDKRIQVWIVSDWKKPVDDISYIEKDDVTGERFEDNPERVSILEKWLNERSQWLAEYRWLKPIDKLFSQFYDINESFKNNPEERELLYGFGVFRTKDNSQTKIHHPLFTKRLRIDDVDIEHNIITVYDTDTDIKFESSFLSKVEGNSIKNIPTILEAIFIT